MFKNVKTCFYCGDDTQITRDHIIPVSYAGGKRHYDRADTVDCCFECNCNLNDKAFLTVEDRAQFLYDRYAVKYRKLLTLPEWSEDELEDMSDDFRRSIKASMVMREIVAERLHHLLTVACEEYPAEKVEHLRGLVTRSRVRKASVGLL
ncbi:TPA: hypothetical protein OUD88_002861 [Enterobacter hormaechei]|nr:hypothetical protein [Enterobacter hormaechei]